MIVLDNLTKSYVTPKMGRHYVFKNLCAEMPAGTNIALLGENGAGKSTLLRIIGGIDFPDAGSIKTTGRISWPVGLVGGFQGSLTGRQNVRFVCRLNSQYGQIEEKIKFVEDFAELGKYFDMPVKSYSSGMKSRLSFGLSMAFEFDYYLLDEVGAVGDARFKAKSEALLKDLHSRAGLIMVSHNLKSLSRLCDVAFLLKGGKAEFFDDVNQAIKVYEDYALKK